MIFSMIMFFNCSQVGFNHLLLLHITISKNIIDGSPSKKADFKGSSREVLKKSQLPYNVYY